MKRILSAIVFSCLTLSLMAQDRIKVSYKGPVPTVVDFARAAFSAFSRVAGEEGGDLPWSTFAKALERHCKGLPQAEGVTLTVDSKHGYMLFECADAAYGDYVLRQEVCYWKEADRRHKLVAFNNLASFNGGRPSLTETSGLLFYRYDNATRRMVWCEPPGFKTDYGGIYELPRIGKDIIFTPWNDEGPAKPKLLKWNGTLFDELSSAGSEGPFLGTENNR